MLVNFVSIDNIPIWVNASHVICVFQSQPDWCALTMPHSMDLQDDVLMVRGTLDEVASKLNGDDVKPLTVEQLIRERRAGMAEAWFGAATHPGLPSDIADKFHMASRRMREPHAGN